MNPISSPLVSFNLARELNTPAERLARAAARTEVNAAASAASPEAAALADGDSAASLTALLTGQMRGAPAAFLAAQGLQRPVSLQALLADA